MAVDVHAARPVAALTNCSVSDTGISSEEQAFLGLINQYRAQNGAPALSISTGLTRMATWHATDMATKNYFSHTDSLGRSFSTRLGQCDASGGSSAENIAAGYSTAQQVFDGWRNSAGHNVNMLNPAYRYIGLARVTGGTYGTYWVTDFSSINPGGSTSGGGTTSTKAVLTSPAPGSRLSGSQATFAWSPGQGAAEYFFYVGTSKGGNNIYAASTGLNTSTTVRSLPTNGSTLYVRLWTRSGSTWQYTDYTYRAAR